MCSIIQVINFFFKKLIRCLISHPVSFNCGFNQIELDLFNSRKIRVPAELNAKMEGKTSPWFYARLIIFLKGYRFSLIEVAPVYWTYVVQGRLIILFQREVARQTLNRFSHILFGQRSAHNTIT